MTQKLDTKVDEFIAEYNSKSKKKVEMSHLDWMKNLDTATLDYRLLESLASLGNPTAFSMPSVLDND